MSSPTQSPEDQQTRNRLKAQEALVHLDALAKDPHFAWFLATVLEKARDEEHEKALSVTLPPDKAEQARWRHDLARELCAKPEALRKMHEKTAGIATS